MNYKEAYDKIITAYFKDEIQPYNGNFCFCGSLVGGVEKWSRNFPDPKFLYKPHQFGEMEEALLRTIRKQTIGFPDDNEYDIRYLFACENININSRDEIRIHHNYEDALFNGMCAALEVLKKIHRQRGENVDDVPLFTKRELSISK